MISICQWPKKLFQHKYEMNLGLFKRYHYCGSGVFLCVHVISKKRKQHQKMVKTDLKTKIRMNLEKPTLPLGTETFSFNKVKLFLESYDKTWLSQLNSTQKKLKHKKCRRKSFFMLQVYKRVLSR